MEKDPSPLDTLRQLKEWLDAGTITPAEFETLKRKLVFDQNEAAAAARPSTTAGPIEDPLLPPVITPANPAPRPTEVPPFSPPTSAVSAEEPRSYELSAASTVPPAAPQVEEFVEEDEPLPPGPARNPLALVLTIGGVVLLLGLVLYLALGNRESERLTSTSRTDADSVAVQPEVGPQAQQIDLPPAAAPETVRVAPAVPPAVASADSTAAASATTPPATTAPTTATPPVADEATVRNRVLNALNSYYDDLKEAPFDASQHFAPTVERFYTMQNTTPAAINDDLTKTHFPEFLEADTQVDPASLQVGPPANDGTRVVTYLEKGKAFRQSRQQHQQTTAQVRVRLDPDYKIVYLRQERLLENTFTD